MNFLVYIIKLSIESIIKCIPVNYSKNNKKVSFKATIISILILSNKIIISLSHGD